MRRYLVLLALAACGPGPADVDARLAARRAALGLSSEPLPFAEAMNRIRQKGHEGLLARIGSRRLSKDEVLDAALDLSNLLASADPATADAWPPDPPDFDARLADARGKALALARAVANDGTGEKEAGDLIASCTACHLIYRKPR